MVATFDDLIEPAYLDRIRDMYLQEGLHYGWKSNKNKSYDQGHWNKTILGENIDKLTDISTSEEFNNHEEIKKLWDLFICYFGDRKLLRCYLNGYTYGTDGYAHTDESKALLNSEKVIFETIIVFLNKNWDIDYAGETVFFDSHREIEKSILPKFGRILVFDSKILHSARPLSRICTDLRLVLAFKTWKDE